MAGKVHFYSALAVQPNVEDALDELFEQLRSQGFQPGEDAVDLVVIFISTHFTQQTEIIRQAIAKLVSPSVMLGSTAEGVIGDEQEIEDLPSISLLAAQLPGVELKPFALQAIDWPCMLLQPNDFAQQLEVPTDTQLFILLADPFSAPIDDVLQAFNLAFSGVPVVGGMSSGALRSNGNTLILDDKVFQEGAVGVALAGNLDIDILVSQGCRPIWRPFVVQAANKNWIYQLERRVPLAWIQDLIPELSEDEHGLLQNGLFVGRAVKAGQEFFGQGDFLVRGVTGVDQQNGAIAVADQIQEGEVIQFHLRDAFTATEDLEMMLVPQMFSKPPDGALLFTCNGRGTRLYDHPNGDISVIRKNLGELHLAGFFCAGEIGPIGDQNFIHGHTASLVLFRSTE